MSSVGALDYPAAVKVIARDAPAGGNLLVNEPGLGVRGLLIRHPVLSEELAVQRNFFIFPPQRHQTRPILISWSNITRPIKRTNTRHWIAASQRRIGRSGTNGAPSRVPQVCLKEQPDS
ncbi:MAG TPA: hypothetical protein VIL66_00120 [Bacillota bacterium]